ncbi:MAG: DUF1353 domain-containing protein [Pseudomonadota bacterium]
MTVVVPRFQYSRIAGKRTAVLQEEMVFDTGIRPDNGYSHTAHGMDRFGKLVVKQGFIWDLGSGPAIDTPGMIYASIPHDALYEAMNMGLLDWKHRKAADEYFMWLLEVAGTPWWRRAYIWIGVRYGYPLARWTGIGL